MKTITATELRVLESLHLRGCTGSMGSMKLPERRKLLRGLIKEGYLTEQCTLTTKGIEASIPKYI